MNWKHVSLKALVVIGAIMVCGSVGGVVLASYMIHHFGPKLIYSQGLSVTMWGTIWGVIWLVDTHHLSMSRKALSAADPATAKKHLGRVRILRSKEESIRREHGLVRSYSDPGRPLGLDSRKGD